MANATRVRVDNDEGHVGYGVLVAEQHAVLYTPITGDCQELPVTATIERDDGSTEEVAGRLCENSGYVGVELQVPVAEPFEAVESVLPQDESDQQAIARYVREWAARHDNDEPPYVPEGSIGIGRIVRWLCRVVFRGNC